MILCGLDFETTGLAIGKVGVTEVGFVKWDTDLGAPIQMAGFLVDPPSDRIWEPGVEKINGLTPDICAKYGFDDKLALRQLLHAYQNSDVAVAHNGGVFDRPLLKDWAERYELDWQPDKLWIDTKTDIDIPARNSTRLVYMAADHGFLNPFPHRAMFDVMTMMTILQKYDLNKVMETAKSPNIVVQGIFGINDLDHREAAKKRGYHWNSPGYEKMWTLPIKACKLEQERAAVKFPIAVIK